MHLTCGCDQVQLLFFCEELDTSKFLCAFVLPQTAYTNFVMPIRPHVSERLPLDGFPWNSILEIRFSPPSLHNCTFLQEAGIILSVHFSLHGRCNCKLVLGTFRKLYEETPHLVIIWQKYGVPHIQTQVRFISGDSTSPERRSVWLKWHQAVGIAKDVKRRRHNVTLFVNCLSR
jgi:hypothetical protein